jgi:hypothetical protein
VERVGNRFIGRFPAVKLYRNDLLELIAAFEDGCERIEVRSGDFQIASGSELDQLAQQFPKGRFDDINIQGYYPFVSIELRSFGVRAYVSQDSSEQLGIVAKARVAIEQGKRLPPWLVLGVPACVLLVAGLVLTFSGLSYDAAVICLAASLPLMSGFLGPGWRRVVVYTRTRHESPGFMQRNRDSIALVLISAVAGGLVTYLITRLLP